MSDREILVARQDGMIVLDGERVFIHKGVTRVRAGHPLLEGREDLFEPLSVQYDVEDATARPEAPPSNPPAAQASQGPADKPSGNRGRRGKASGGQGGDD